MAKSRVNMNIITPHTPRLRIVTIWWRRDAPPRCYCCYAIDYVDYASYADAIDTLLPMDDAAIAATLCRLRRRLIR